MEFTSDIKGRGLLASLTIRQWTASRLDKQGSKAAAQAAGAKETRGNYHKRLIDPDLLKPVQKAARAARDYHERMTVPWSYAGVGMLPGVSVMEYDLEMQRLEAAFYAEVDKLVAAYPSAVAAAAMDLGSYFDVTEYPTQGQVRAKFSMQSHLSTLPDHAVDDFRVDIPLSVKDKIRSSVLSEYEALTRKCKESLLERVQHCRDRVWEYHQTAGTDNVSTFRASTVEHVGEAAQLACRANIADNEALRTATDTLLAMAWDSVHADNLRSSADARMTTIKALDSAIDVLTHGV